MANRYWVGGTASWDATAGSKWSTTSGGSGGSAVPTASDDVFFDANSGANTITLSATGNCRSLNCTGFTGTLVHNSAITLNIGTSTAGASNIALKLVSGMTYTLGSATTSAIAFVTTSATQQTIETGGKTLGNTSINTNANASYLLNDALTLGTAATLTHGFGTLNTNGKTVSVGVYNGSSSNTRTLTLGASSFSVTGTGTVWNFSTATNLTFNANTSTISVTDTSATSKTFAGGGKTFNTVTFSGDNVTVSGANIFSTLNVNNAGLANGLKLTSGVTQTVTTLSTNGSTGSPTKIVAVTSASAATISISSGTVALSWCYLKDITVSGGATFTASKSFDGSGNSGWTSITDQVVAAGGNSNTAGTWESNNLPTSRSNLLLTSGSGQLTVNGSLSCRSLDCTGYTNTLTHNSAVTITIGDATAGLGNVALKFVSGMTYTLGSSSTSAIAFASTSATQQTIETAGKTCGNLTTGSASGSPSYLLSDNLTLGSAATLTHTFGTLNTNSNAVSCGVFSSSNSNTRTITLGSSVVSITGPGPANAWTMSTTTGLTLNPGTSEIRITDTGSSTKPFAGGGKTFNNLTITGDNVSITGANTFATLSLNNAGLTTGTKLPASTTTTISSLSVTGTPGNSCKLVSSSSGTVATLSCSSSVNVNYLYVKDITASGSTPFVANKSFDGGNNTLWTMTDQVVAAGGNSNAAATWESGNVPVSRSVLLLTSTSGQLTINAALACRSLDCTGYTGTLTHNAACTLSVGDATAPPSGVALKLVSGMTYTLGNTATSAISFVTSHATQQTVETAGKTCGNVTFSGTGASWKLLDNLTATGGTLSITTGTFDSNNKTINVGTFTFGGGSTRTVTLGSSSITAGTWSCTSSTGLTFNSNTSSVVVTSTFNQSNVALTYYDLTLPPTGATLNYTQTVSHNLTCNGSAGTGRALLKAVVYGTQVSLVCNGAVSFSYADFEYIAASGTANWDLSGITGGSGDCIGNSGITFTTSQTQTWQGTSGGNWSANAWTTRPPLPQDDVVINAAFSASQTITHNMARSGRSIDWTGTTGAPTWTLSQASYLYGSLTMASNVVVSVVNVDLTFRGVSASTFTSAGVSFGCLLGFNTGSGSVTLQDDIVVSHPTASCSMTNGTLYLNDHKLNLLYFVVGGTSNPALTLDFGTSGELILNRTAGTVLQVQTTNATFPGSGTITFAGSSSSAKTFQSLGLTYPNITINSGVDNLTITSSGNTFSCKTLTISNAGGTNGTKFTAGQTYTVTGLSATGTAGNLIKLVSTPSGTAFTLSKSSGTVTCDYLSLQDSTATGGATWYAGSHSTNVSGNSGWLFSDPPPAGVSFDASSTSSYQSMVTDYSWSHTCSGAERYLTVGISIFSSGTTVSSLTYNGTAMSLLKAQATSGDSYRVELWGLVAPDTGTHSVSVSLTGATADSTGMACSFNGVHQTVPTEAATSATATNGASADDITVDVTTVADGDWCVDAIVSGDTLNGTTVGAGQTSRVNDHSALGNAAMSTEGPKSPAGAVTMSWSADSFISWATCSLALRSSSATSGGPFPFFMRSKMTGGMAAMGS